MGWQEEEISRRKQEKEAKENKEIELKKYNEAILNLWKQLVAENSKLPEELKLKHTKGTYDFPGSWERLTEKGELLLYISPYSEHHITATSATGEPRVFYDKINNSYFIKDTQSSGNKDKKYKLTKDDIPILIRYACTREFNHNDFQLISPKTTNESNTQRGWLAWLLSK